MNPAIQVRSRVLKKVEFVEDVEKLIMVFVL